MSRRLLGCAALGACLLLMETRWAAAQVAVGVRIGRPVAGYYVQPAVAYAAPQPVVGAYYYAPAPVYVAPRPVVAYYPPAPVVYPAPVAYYGFWGRPRHSYRYYYGW